MGADDSPHWRGRRGIPTLDMPMHVTTFCPSMATRVHLTTPATTAHARMEQAFEIQTVLTGQLAELYAAVLEEFENKSDISLEEMNRTLLQTGILHHLTMMQGLGLLDAEKGKMAAALMEEIGKDSLMWEVVELARKHWGDSAGGTGTVDLQA